MSDEATTELTPVQGEVDLDAVLREGSSEGAADTGADERSDQPSTNEADQRKDADESQYELRLRNLQAAKDREIASIQRELQQHRQANEIYEQSMLQLAVEQARQQGGDQYAQQIANQYQVTRERQSLQTREQQLQQAYLAQQAEAAQLLAWKLASDPKFEGVDSNELMRWARYGPEAMVQAAENLALAKRASGITSRKARKSDNMGGGSGGAGDVTSTMKGADLIEFAFKNSKRNSRWS
jgi:hypothetical protein